MLRKMVLPEGNGSPVTGCRQQLCIPNGRSNSEAIPQLMALITYRSSRTAREVALPGAQLENASTGDGVEGPVKLHQLVLWL